MQVPLTPGPLMPGLVVFRAFPLELFLRVFYCLTSSCPVFVSVVSSLFVVRWPLAAAVRCPLPSSPPHDVSPPGQRQSRSGLVPQLRRFWFAATPLSQLVPQQPALWTTSLGRPSMRLVHAASLDSTQSALAGREYHSDTSVISSDMRGLRLRLHRHGPAQAGVRDEGGGDSGRWGHEGMSRSSRGQHKAKTRSRRGSRHDDTMRTGPWDPAHAVRVLAVAAVSG